MKSVFLVINECQNETLNDCDKINGECVDTLDSFVCRCRQGYFDVVPSKPGRQCTNGTVVHHYFNILFNFIFAFQFAQSFFVIINNRIENLEIEFKTFTNAKPYTNFRVQVREVYLI